MNFNQMREIAFYGIMSFNQTREIAFYRTPNLVSEAHSPTFSENRGLLFGRPFVYLRIQMGQLFQNRESALTKAYRNGELSVKKELEPLQLRLAWRIIRTHAICKGQLGRMELLSYLEPAKWVAPMPDASPQNRSDLGREIANIWAGLPLISKDATHTAALKKTAKLLHPIGADPLFTDIYALKLHSAFPSRSRLIFYEEQFLTDLADSFMYKGHVKFISEARIAYGLSRHEALSLVPLVRSFISDSIEIDIETDQRLMVARTESLISRAQDAADLRAETAALKHLAVVQGLARIEPNDPMREFESIVKEINVDATNKRLEQEDDDDLPRHLLTGTE